MLWGQALVGACGWQLHRATSNCHTFTRKKSHHRRLTESQEALPLEDAIPGIFHSAISASGGAAAKSTRPNSTRGRKQAKKGTRILHFAMCVRFQNASDVQALAFPAPDLLRRLGRSSNRLLPAFTGQASG